MKKLTAILASTMFISGTTGCTHNSYELESYISGIDSQQALVKRLKAQTGQAGEIFLRLYVTLNKDASKSASAGKYCSEEKVLFSLDNKTVVVPKPDEGNYEKDLFVRRFEKEICKKEDKNYLSDLSLMEVLGLNDSDSEDKQTESKKDCSLESVVMVYHYAHHGPSEVNPSEVKNGKIKYKIDKDTGKPKMEKGKDSYGRLWVPRDAFGVYLLDETNEVISENLLAEQDIKVLDDGSVVLKTEELGQEPMGNYKVKVVTKYKRGVVDDLTKAKWGDIQLSFRIGMSLGSLEHIYSGPDPSADSKDQAHHVNLLMSNFHVWNNSLGGGDAGIIKENGKLKMIYITLAAMPLAKLDDDADAEWIPVAPYEGLFSETLDVAIVKLLRPIKDKNFPTIIWNEEEPKVGERAIVVGHPLGINDTIVNTRGTISKVGHYAGSDFKNAILFFGDIQGGNSGGGLYNASGEFIGIPSASYVHIYNESIETATEVPRASLEKALDSEYDKKINLKELRNKQTDIMKKLLAIPEINEAYTKLRNPEKAKELAKDIYNKVSEEYKNGETAHAEIRRPVIVDTGINLARSSIEIQKWLNSLGINIGQKVKKDWSD